MKKKLFTILAVLLTLTLTSCSDFWNWVEEVEDESAAYSFCTGTLDSEEYRLLFRDVWGVSQLERGGFYTKDSEKFTEKSTYLASQGKTKLYKWSGIEEQLYQLGYKDVSREIEVKLKNDEKIIYIEKEEKNVYRFFYIYLVNDRL